MRLSKEQRKIADVMLWAVSVGYFNYGDRVEYLPKSDKFKVVSGDLDKPLYMRFGAFYHDWSNVSEKDQKEILEAYNDEKNHYKIKDTDCGYVFDIQFKTFETAYRLVCLNAKALGRKCYEIDYYQHVVDEQYTHYENCLKARGITL